MPLLFLNPETTEHLIHSLSWTLIHTLWQGMLLAMMAGGIVFFTRKSSAAMRYNLLTAALFMFVTGVALTFILQVTTAQAPVDQSAFPVAVSAIVNPQAEQLTGVEDTLPATARAIRVFNANAGWIVLAWLLIIGFRCMRLAAGLYGVYQMKNKHTFPPGEYWYNRMMDLSRELNIKKRVRLLQSGIAKMPSVVGFFKPVILFPAGMLTSLQPDEVEAILAHELAHIRRHDFLVNMLQSVVEIILFFNPAVKWVSSLIRQERENCCDDIAVNHTHNKRNYVNALVSFQSFNLQLNSPLVNAFGAEKNHLINRIKRIIYNDNKTLNNMEKKFLAAGLVITSAFIFAFTTTSNNLAQKATHNSEAIQRAVENTGEEQLIDLTAVNDTLPSPKNKNISTGTINTTLDGKNYKIVTRDNEMTELYVDDKKIPAEKMDDYKPATQKILLQVKIDREQSEKDMLKAQQDMKASQEERAQSEKEMVSAKLEMEKSKEQMELDMKHMQKEMEESNEVMERSNKEMEEAKVAQMQNMEEAKVAVEQARKDMEQAKIQVEQSKKEIARSMKEMKESQRQMELAKKDMEASKKMQEDFVSDLVKEKIIQDKKDLFSYRLSEDELIVNDVKQPDTVHKKFKYKYVKGQHWIMQYNNKEEAK